MMQVTFAEFTSVLQASASTVDAAEGHGCLCGALCTGADYSLERWLDEMIPLEDRALSERDAQLLQRVFEEAQRSLRSDEMSFAPLLPEEDDALERRAATMAQWARGFLYGFGTGGALPAGGIPAAVDEVLRDVAQIGNAEVDADASGEEEEQAYTEVFEYLRVGVQLVHDELAAMRAPASSPAPVQLPADDDVPLSKYGDEDDFADPLGRDELH